MGDDKDFLEDDDFFEDDDFSDEDLEGEGTQSSHLQQDDDDDFDFEDDDLSSTTSSSSAEEPAKKSSSMLLYAAVGGLVLIGGGVAALQMGLIGGGSSAPSQTAAMSTPAEPAVSASDLNALSDLSLDQPAASVVADGDLAISSDASPAKDVSLSEEKPSETTDLDAEFAALLSDEPAVAEEPTISPVTDAPDSAPVELEFEEIEAPTPAQEIAALDHDEDTSSVAAPEMEKSAPAEEEVASVPAASAMTTALHDEMVSTVEGMQDGLSSVEVTLSSQGDDIEDLTTRISAIEKSLSQISDQQSDLLSEVKSVSRNSQQAVAQRAPLDTELKADLAKTQKAVDALSSKVSSLSDRLDAAPKASTSKTVASGVKSSVDAVKGMTEKAVEKVAAIATPSKTTKVKSGAPTPQVTKRVVHKSTSKSGATTQPRKVVRQAKWQLVSAKPGIALLSLYGNDTVRMTVKPGYYLQDLGVVTAIRMISGRWVVETTNGMVR